MSETQTRYFAGGRTGGVAPKRKRTLYLIGGGVGIIGVWYMLQRRKASAALPDPNATDASGTDPNAGLDTGTSPALMSYTDPSTGAIISGGGWNAGVGSVPTQFLSAPGNNAQWTQQAIAYLVQNGFDPITVSVALGKYMANQNLTNDELVVVEAAISAEGQPPTPPQPPHVAPPAGQTSTGTVSQSVTKPKTPTGLRVASHRKGTAVLVWNAEPGANEYRLHYNGVPVRMVTPATATVHRNGKWSVASVRGSYTSHYTTPVTVKGI